MANTLIVCKDKDCGMHVGHHWCDCCGFWVIDNQYAPVFDQNHAHVVGRVVLDLASVIARR